MKGKLYSRIVKSYYSQGIYDEAIRIGQTGMRVLKEKASDPNLAGFKFVENFLGIEGTVKTLPVGARNPGVVTAHDEMGAAVIFSDNRMPNRFTGARITHRRGKDG